MDEKLFEYGYCMGLIVGEGSFTHSSGTFGKHGSPVCKVTMVSDPAPIAALHRLFGGHARLDGQWQGSNRHIWTLQGRALRNALPILDALLPTSLKRAQYLAWRADWAEFFERNKSSRRKR